MKINKLIIIPFIFIALFFSCKRKFNETRANRAEHCYNNKLDSLETNIDCGGVCDECYPVIIPENNLKNNQIVLQDSTFAIDNIIKEGNNLIIYFNKENCLTIKLLFPKDIVYPNKYTNYDYKKYDEFYISLNVNSSENKLENLYNVSSNKNEKILSVKENNNVIFYLNKISLMNNKKENIILSAKLIIP